jgi:hypothetical protein
MIIDIGDSMVIITAKFIHENSTKNGGWTATQFKALGLTWADKTHGWINRIVGKEITDEAAQAFIDGKAIYSKGSGKKAAEKAFLNRLKQAAVSLANLTEEQRHELDTLDEQALRSVFLIPQPPMTITMEWLIRHAAVHNSYGNVYTAAQVEVLGLKYPLQKGWMTALVGKELTPEQVQRFIEAKDIRQPPDPRKGKDPTVRASLKKLGDLQVSEEFRVAIEAASSQ